MALRRCAVQLAKTPQPKVMGTLGTGGGRYQDGAGWNFWDPVWGGNENAMFEEPYFTRREMGHKYVVDRPHEGRTHIRVRPPIRARNHAGAAGNPDMSWAARGTPDSAIEVEATQVTCFGTGNSVNMYFSPRTNTTNYSMMHQRHHMVWIAVPPDRTVCCKYCRVHFKRKKGWAPAFDENLKPEIGYIPEGGSLDPCLAGNTKGEAVPGAVKI